MSKHELTDQNFEEEVLKAKELMLVDFWAEWCGPCKVMLPIMEELEKEYEGKSVKIGELNVDENQKTVQQYNILSIPTFILFKDGKPLTQFSGVQTKEKIKKLIDQNI